MRHPLCILILAALFAVGCKKDKDPKPNGTRSGFTAFPSAAGNAWHYHTRSETNFTSGPLSPTVIVDSFLSRWTVIGDTAFNGFNAFKIEQIDSAYNGSYHNASATYYTNQDDFFYGLATTNFGSSFFLRPDEEAVMPVHKEFGFSPFRVDAEDTLQVPDTLLRFLKFPIVTGDTWLSHEYGSQFHAKRRWLGDENVTVPVGTFACKKLQVFFDHDNDGEPTADEIQIFQYFSANGLIKEVRSENIEISDGSSGTYVRVTELRSLNF